MSRASIEQALTGLVPTLNGPLPPELIDLALSLLTRSRTVATSMKSDEEIARPYACAQLACERLKKRLNLPSITSRPPCPPRIYKKLYNYLSSALPDSFAAAEPQTPRKSSAPAPTSTRNTPKTPLSARKTPHSTKRARESDGEPPEWVMPAIRALAKAFEYPAVIPHVYTGVESIYPLLARMAAAAAETPSKRPRRPTSASQSFADVSDTRLCSLVVVVFLLVFSRMKDVDVSPDTYNEWLAKAMDAVLKTPSAQNITQDELAPAIEQTMAMAKEEGWLQMQWFDSVKPLDNEDEMEGVEMTGNTTAKAKGLGLRSGSDYIGLGTMMQDATDYLGERQQDDYEKWKNRIMARVQEIEAA
ncbi:hypothetical protein COCMIDRAFT_7583 [Bipolaris oryzae ATCC 44560]|uniref:ORC6 first cyclin-like domain-containing protein n=1 Tax=Bipolaris oryzae ATCC 44560 TaxID=930090 RepID=W6Z5T8_COCMI|nr:uncharacterized protein COCMIDRAFT_7583 [Bipolaris oryzae ATCC 44560]EUC42919.1 hypothetical protein COCMIDRAFT_7583 [Bipolaris oryzae ATCC 44560]